MKKIISLFAAIAMVSTMFVTSVSAADPLKLTTTVKKVDATDYNDNYDTLASGYELYQIDVVLEGAEFENTNTGIQPAQLKKPTGHLPLSIMYQLDFGDTVGDIKAEAAWTFPIPLAVDVVGSLVSFHMDTWTNAAPYPMNPNTGYTAIAAGDPIISIQLPVAEGKTPVATIKTFTLVDADFTSGAMSNEQQWSFGEENVKDDTTSITFGEVSPAIVKVDKTTNAKNFVAKSETIDNNYGFAKIDKPLNPGAFDYEVKAYAGGESKTWKLLQQNDTFAHVDGYVPNEKGILEGKIKEGQFDELGSFYIVVKSASKVIDKVEILAKPIN